MVFQASPDKSVKIITSVTTVLFLGIVTCGVITFITSGHGVLIVPSLVLAIIYLVCYLYHPLHYEILQNELIIRRPVNSIRINKSNIQSVELLDSDKLKNSIRTFGVGGLFGYYGNFSNFALGSMVWYATRKDKGVLIITSEKKHIIITPDDPQKFILQF